MRISDVQVADGTIMQFEVRFGANATSRVMPTAPRSGMIQVNLATGNTRVVQHHSQSSLQPTGHRNVGV